MRKIYVLKGGQKAPRVMNEPTEIIELGREDYIKQYISEFKRFRDEFIEELPNGNVNSRSKPNNYKCRITWFSAVSFALNRLLKDRLVSGEIYKESRRIIENKSPLTKPEDIRRMNITLNCAIKQLEDLLAE